MGVVSSCDEVTRCRSPAGVEDHGRSWARVLAERQGERSEMVGDGTVKQSVGRSSSRQWPIVRESWPMEMIEARVAVVRPFGGGAGGNRRSCMRARCHYGATAASEGFLWTVKWRWYDRQQGDGRQRPDWCLTRPSRCPSSCLHLSPIGDVVLGLGRPAGTLLLRRPPRQCLCDDFDAWSESCDG